MQGRKGSRRWMVWLGWMAVVGALLLTLTMTVGQRINDEARVRQRLDERTLLHRFPVSPSHRFSISPSPLPTRSFRSRQQSQNVELIGATGGAIYDVFVKGNIAYCAGGHGLSIFDVSDPTKPKILANVVLPAPAEDVYVSGSYAYVADEVAGLRVVDVSNPSSPSNSLSVFPSSRSRQGGGWMERPYVPFELPKWNRSSGTSYPSRQLYLIRRLTISPADDIQPSWSPDGTTIVFASNRINSTDGYDLFAINPDGTGEKLLAKFTVTDPWGGRFYAPLWLGRSGDILVMDMKYFWEVMRFHLSQAIRDRVLPVERNVWDGDSPYFTRLIFVPPGYNPFRSPSTISPVASPDGTKIAFHYDSWKEGKWVVRVYEGTLDAFLGNVDDVGRTVFQVEPDGAIGAGDKTHSFSPDGTKLVVTACPSGWSLGKRRDLYVIDLTTGLVYQLTNTGQHGVDNGFVDWSSNNIIVFSSRINDSSAYDLYMIHPDGTGLTRLTDTPWNEIDPSWSPDGKSIAFAADKEGNYDIYIMDLQPTNQPPSTPTLLSPSDNATVSPTPTFKMKSTDPDGDQVKFEIEVVKGGETKPLTFTTAFVDSGSEASFTVPTDQSLSEGQWTWKARAIDSRGAEGEWSGERIFWITSSRRFISLGIGRAEDVSRDGSVVVGITETPEHYNRAFVWRKEEGELIEIGTLSGTDSLALSVSGDGEKVVGISTTSDGRSLPFIWTVGEGIKALDSLEGGAWDISDDGSSIVGSDEFGAVIWKSGTRQRIVEGGIAKGISHDGKVVVGEMMTDRGLRAFRWANGILQDLGTLGGDLSTALRVSSNGNIVVGYSKNAQGKHRAFRWTIDGVMHDLGTLGGGWSEARDISANGEVIVGISETKEGRSHAFLWTPTTGMQDLNQVFAQYIPQGFELVSADGISYDGRYIVGSAFSPDGKIVAFWLDTGVTTQNKPDLIPVELTLSKSEVLAGDKLTISFKVVNQGSAKANASKTNVRLSKNADKPSPNDPLLAQLDTPALEPNESVTHSREVTIPNDTEIGDYYVWVIVDADSTVGQSDETNDRINTPLKVIVIEAAIDAKLLELIDKYATSFYKKEWNVTLNQFKLWIATIAWGEAGLGGYGAHSQGNPSYNGDVFYHKDVDKSFRFSTGIGYFQLDRGGLQWDNWPTIEKLNPEKAVESVMKWHYNKFGKKATLDDFSKESAWNAVKPGKVETRWRQVTGTSWDDHKDKKDLDWDLRETILAERASKYSYLRQEANFTYLGKKRWSVTEGDQVKTDSGKQVVFNGDCDTWLVNARAWDGTLLFSYYYTYDPNNGIEIWAWKDDPKYIFVREYGTMTGGQFPDGRIKDTNKAGFTLKHFAVDKDKGPLLTASSQYSAGDQRLRYRIFAPLGSVSKLANRQAGLMVIVNPLDRNLDEQTVQFEGVSHPTALIEQSVDLGRREVQWRFQLANVDADQVWVQFSVLPKSDVPSGERIINRALVKVEETQSETNEIVTIIDKAPPQVSLQPLPPVQPKPVFEIQWETDDDVSGVSEVEVWVSDNGAAPEFWASFIPMMTQATFKGKFGHEYRFYSVAVDKAGNRSPIPDQPQAVTKAGQAPSIQRGLRIVSLPVISEISDPKQVFNFDGDKWAWYDPTVTDPNQRYIRYPDARAGLQVGKGFWARFGQDVTPNAKGDLPDDTQPFAIALKGGSWNLIGNPWLSDLTWDVSAIQVKIGEQTKPLNDLQPGEGVEPYAWRWDGSQYQLVFDSKLLTGVGNKILAWEGAWVYAHQDCELILPPPSQSKGRGTRDAGRVVKGNGWTVKLVAKVDDESGEAILGVSQGSRGLSIGLPPEPPEGSSNVQVIVLNNGASLAVDVRNNAARQQVWDVVVKFGTRDGRRGTRQKEVTLTWDGVGYAPKDVSLTLVDLATGTRRYMRTQTEYRFVPNEGENERRFKVIAELGNERPLRIVGLKAIPMRGRGISIQFALTKPAQTQVEVLTLTGRKVAVLESGRNRLAGQQQIVWQGLGNNGEVLPTSAYLVRVIAQDDEGRKIQGTTIARLR